MGKGVTKFFDTVNTLTHQTNAGFQPVLTKASGKLQQSRAGHRDGVTGIVNHVANKTIPAAF